MLQAVDNALWQLRDVVVATVGYIVSQYCDNLVVGLVAIQHTESANRLYVYNDVTVCNVTLGQYADVEWIAITNNLGASTLLHTILCNALATEALRNKAIECRYDIRILLWSVNLEIAAHLVELVLYGVGWDNLDKCGDHLGGLLAHLDTVPRMRLVAQSHQSCNRVINFVSHNYLFLLTT